MSVKPVPPLFTSLFASSLLIATGLSSSALAQTSTQDIRNADRSTNTAIINPADTMAWSICNETSFILRLAHATLRDGEVKAKGWREAKPGDCIAETVARNAPRFLYAESSPVHRGGIREWKGDVTLCAKDEDFISAATDNCRVMNFDTRDYFAVKPGEETTTLIEPSDFKDKALTAGTQRLLRDAGYKITAVDGVPGRRTSRSLREFQKAESLDALPEGPALISALAAAAQTKMDTIGLEFCNKSDTDIFAAIGLQEDGNWTSRGWWQVKPETCVRSITRALQGLDMHYYALKAAKIELPVDGAIPPTDSESKPPDLKLRSIATIPAQFCIAEAQFSALGREMCLESGYGVANFRPLPTDKDGITVTLTNEDFARTGPAGLRQ
jgi:uncharacterized membrane protein